LVNSNNQALAAFLAGETEEESSSLDSDSSGENPAKQDL
jgi:hypothetical protein